MVGVPLAGATKRRHSRGRSVTSKAEMMSRPNSAKARMDHIPQQSGLATSHTGGGIGGANTSAGPNTGMTSSNPTRPLSPPAVGPGVKSPTHHKSPTVTGAYGPAIERESKSHHRHALVRPHSTHIVQGNVGLSSHTMASAAAASASALGDGTHGASLPTTPSSTPTSSTVITGTVTNTTVVTDNESNKTSVPSTVPPSSSQVEINRLQSSSSAATSPLRMEAPPTPLSSDNSSNILATAATPSVLPPVDVCAPPSSAMPPDAKLSREIKEGSKIKESHSVSMVSGLASADKVREVGMRKGSEPPPSLQAIFSRDSMGSSRRWSNRQFSVDEIHNAMHPKQHSLDSSYLQSITPQSPKYRRVKSPSVSDKNTTTPTMMDPSSISTVSTTASSIAATTPVPATSTSMVALGGDVGERGKRDSNNLHRTPSQPHLNSANASPQVSRSTAGLTSSLDISQPISRAQSTQQLKLAEDSADETVVLQQARTTRSKSGSNADLSYTERERPGTPSGLKSLKDRELSQSKESLDISKDPLLESGMKRAGSRESLKGKEACKVIQPPVKEHSLSLSVMSSPVGGSTARDMNKENWERSAPLKDMQSSAEGSVENMQASFTEVGEEGWVCVRMWVGGGVQNGCELVPHVGG